jgi:hypothetical protein
MRNTFSSYGPDRMDADCDFARRSLTARVASKYPNAAYSAGFPFSAQLTFLDGEDPP